MAKVEFEPIKPQIGARVLVDRACLFDDDVAQACLAALEDRGVLVFPQVNLTDAEQLALTDKLGERVNFSRNAPGGDAAAQDVYKVTLDKTVNAHPEYVLGTFFWHIDGVTIDQPLPKATLLSARKLSAKGGQTEFANLYAAFEHLPAAEKAELKELRVVHTIAASMKVFMDEVNEETVVLLNKAVDVVHPFVWTHESGRKSLLVGSHADHVVDMPYPHGRALITRMIEWAGQPEFRYTHQWQPGDFVIWDNCGLMHRVVPYDENSGRTMHRTTLAGHERVV
ncbi:TauD/TfdA dioxygenase family protein [Caulobacter sp. LARHSG274]